MLSKELIKVKMDLYEFLFKDSFNTIDNELHKILCETRLSIINKILFEYKWGKSPYLLFQRFRNLASDQNFSTRELRLLKSKAKMMFKKGKCNIDSLCWLFPGKYKETIKLELVNTCKVNPNKMT